MKGYSARDVAKMLDLSVDEVRSLAREGVLRPERGQRGEYRFSFQDLVLLRTAKGLRAAHVPPRRLRAALRSLREQLPQGQPLSAVQIEAHGERVVVRHGEALWNPESGQSEFNFDVAELADRVAPHARRAVAEARSSEQEMTGEEWFELGFDLEAAAPDQAIEAYKEALERSPGHLEARINLGRLLQLAGDLHLAEAHFRIALSYDADNATALFNLGVTLEDQKRLDEARTSYLAAIEADAGLADAYFNLARLLEQAGDSQGALRHLKNFRKLTERTTDF